MRNLFRGNFPIIFVFSIEEEQKKYAERTNGKWKEKKE